MHLTERSSDMESIKQRLVPVVTPNAKGPRLMAFEEQGQDEPQVLPGDNRNSSDRQN